MIIDIFSHLISESVGTVVEKAKYYGEGKEFPYPPENADPEVRLALMEKYGIDVQALCQTTPVLRSEERRVTTMPCARHTPTSS